MALKAVAAPLGSPVGGSGTANTIPRWTGPSTLGDSALVQSGTNAVGFGTPKTWGTNFTLNAIQLSESASLSADINTTYLAANQYWDSPGFQNRRIKANFAARYLLNGASGDHQFQIAPFGAADSVITWSTAMTILNTSGNVGIGTASPTASSTIFKANNSLGAWNAQDLSVDGLSNGDAVYQRWYATAVAGAVGRFGISFSAGVASFVWNSLYNAGVTSSELMRLTGGGNLGIGTTSPTAALDTPASTTTRATLRIRSGVAPTAPNDGDIWFTGATLHIRIAGVTRTFTVV